VWISSIAAAADSAERLARSFDRASRPPQAKKDSITSAGRKRFPPAKTLYSMDSASRDVSVASTSNAPEQSTSWQSGTLTTSIDVVAFRKTKIVPVVSTRAQLRHDLAS
jgi:hypothetical protein